jgi:hypothetical protein
MYKFPFHCISALSHRLGAIYTYYSYHAVDITRPVNRYSINELSTGAMIRQNIRLNICLIKLLAPRGFDSQGGDVA